MIIRDKEYRDTVRKHILNAYPIENEVFAFHPHLDNYLISNTGKVKNAVTGKLLKQQVNNNGYFGVNVKHLTRGRRFMLVHRLVAETFLAHLGTDNYFYETNHIDGNKKNNKLDNLEWLTRKENLDHATKNKLHKSFKGEKNGNSKLKDKDLSDMIELQSLGFKVKDICEAYKVDRNYINGTMKRRIKNERNL